MRKLFEFSEEYEGEGLSKRGRKKKSSFKIPAFLVPLVCVLFFIAVLLFSTFLIPIVNVSVKGNEHCQKEVVVNKFFTSSEDYRLSSVLKKWVFGIHDDAFSSCKIQITGLQSCSIVVKEAEAVAQIYQEGSYIFLSAKGVVTGNLSVKDENILLIEGITLLSYQDFSKPKVESEQRLSDCLSIAEQALVVQILPDLLYCKEENYYITFGTVTVSLGQNVYMKEKLEEIYYQLPAYKNLTGILHIENFDLSDTSPYFFFEVTE